METEHKDLNELIFDVLTEGDRTEAASINLSPKKKKQKNDTKQPKTQVFITNFNDLESQMMESNVFSVKLSDAKINLLKRIGKPFYPDALYGVIRMDDESKVVTVRPLDDSETLNPTSQSLPEDIQVPFSALLPKYPSLSNNEDKKKMKDNQAAWDWVVSQQNSAGALSPNDPDQNADIEHAQIVQDFRDRDLTRAWSNYTQYQPGELENSDYSFTDNKDDEKSDDMKRDRILDRSPRMKIENVQFTEEPNMETITESKKKESKKKEDNDNKDLFDSDMKKAHEKGFSLRKPPKKRPFMKKKSSCD